MEIAILAVGRMRAGPEAELCARYLERARRGGKALGLSGFGVREFSESRGARPAERIAAEGSALLAALGKADRAVALDPGGELVDSEAFARSLLPDTGAPTARLAFVIGGPDGLAEGVLARSARRFCFGRLTWPHQICRILLAEQLYRAMTILSGHPYHRA